MQEHEVTLTLMVTAPMSREALEEWTVHAEDALEARASDVALGAAAAANFTDNAVEIDFVIRVASPVEVHDHIARVVRILEEAGFQSPDAPEAPPMQLTASATHAVAACA